MDDSDHFEDDQEFDLALLEQLEQNGNTKPVANEEGSSDEFDDDMDLDLVEELVQVAGNVERGHATSTTATGSSGIIFVSSDQDPPPPPLLPESTVCSHPVDRENLRTWIYPTNYPIRGYQLNIVQKAMFSNTLVALPTGLGKTFIAAVVMFNYWRWFPTATIIFMAPTRPLVTQQIEACFKICGLPQDETAELTGYINAAKRKDIWATKRVIFTTPQTVDNDLDSKNCVAEKVACIVVDEAHRATGNYAYTNVVKKIYKRNKEFRILALTATPGSSMDAVQAVVANLHITNTQIRTEDSMDIREFSHGKRVERVIVPLQYTHGTVGILPRVIDDFRTKVFQPVLDTLSRRPSQLASTDPDRNSHWALHSNRERFTATAKNINQSLKFLIFSEYMLAETYSRAYERLCQYGVGSFVETIETGWADLNIKSESGKKLSRAESQFANNTVLKSMIPYLQSQMQLEDFSGHPKQDRVVSVLLNHFSNTPEGEVSKVIIFSEFRNSVNEINNLLKRHAPIIRSQVFVGQAEGKGGTKGLKQHEQEEVIQKFKNDSINVLVATSIGEEGLDIGEVDLIVCYDSSSSPIRMLQRMGRTGRKRKGRCIMLMTELEQKKLQKAEQAYAFVQRLIAQGSGINYFKPNPTILPPDYRPAICRKELAIGNYIMQPSKRKRNTTLKNLAYEKGLLKDSARKQFAQSFNNNNRLTHNAFQNMDEVRDYYWPIPEPLSSKLSKYVSLQGIAKPTYRIGHSTRTAQLVALVEKCEDRILYPDNEVSVSIPVLQQQTKLVLPSKVATTSSNTLRINKRLKPRTESGQTTLPFILPEKSSSSTNRGSRFAEVKSNFDDFMEHNSTMGAFFNSEHQDEEIMPSPVLVARKTTNTSTNKPASKPSIFTSAAELREFNLEDIPDIDVAPSPPPLDPYYSPTPPTTSRDKGKGRMRASQEERVAAADQEPSDNDDEMHDPKSWSSLLPESVYEEAMPFIDRFVDNNPFRKKVNETNEMDLDILDDMSPKEETALALDDEKSPPSQVLNDGFDHDSMNDFDDFDDFSFMNESILKRLTEYENKPVVGFDDVLLPQFQFEQEEQNHNVNSQQVVFIWAHRTPTFSSEAIKVLQKRQLDFKRKTGRFVKMETFQEYSNTKDGESETKEVISFHNSTSPISTIRATAYKNSTAITSQSSLPAAAVINKNIDMVDSTDKPVDLTKDLTPKKHQQITEPSCTIVIEDSQPADLDVSPHEIHHTEVLDLDQEDDDKDAEQLDGEEFGFADFNEDTLASFFENKIDEDGGGVDAGFHTFLFEEEPIKSPQRARMSLSTRKGNGKKSSPVSVAKITDSLEITHVGKGTTSSPPAKQIKNLDIEQIEKEKEEVIQFDFDFTSLDSSSSDEESSKDKEDDEVVILTKPNNNKHITAPTSKTKSILLSSRLASKKVTIPKSVPPSPITTILPEKRERTPFTNTIPFATNESSINQQPFRKRPIDTITSDDDDDDENNTPQRNNGTTSLLNKLSKGQYTPSPLHPSETDESLSPILMIRRKKPRNLIQDDITLGNNSTLPDNNIKPKKRLKRKAPSSTPRSNASSVVMDTEFMIQPPSSRLFKQKIKKAGGDVQKLEKYRRPTKLDAAANPFIDYEAEQSSDEGHTDDDTGASENSSALNSFIVDDDAMEQSRGSLEDDELMTAAEDRHGRARQSSAAIYARSLLDNEGASNERHWLNRFNTEKWLSVAQDHEEGTGEDEDESEEEQSSIQEFSSDYITEKDQQKQFATQIMDEDEDDFM